MAPDVVAGLEPSVGALDPLEESQLGRGVLGVPGSGEGRGDEGDVPGPGVPPPVGPAGDGDGEADRERPEVQQCGAEEVVIRVEAASRPGSADLEPTVLVLEEPPAVAPGGEDPCPRHHRVEPSGGDQLADTGGRERHRLAVERHLGAARAVQRDASPRCNRREHRAATEQRPAAGHWRRGHDRTVCREAGRRPGAPVSGITR